MAPLFPAPRVRARCVSKEAVKSAAGGVKRALLLLRAVMNQRPAVITDHSMQKSVRRYLPEGGIFVEVADDLPA